MNGQLRKTPHIDGPDVHEHDTVNHCYYRLNEVRSYQWRDIFIEDAFVVESMQKGRHSSKYDGGKFSAVMDAPTHYFHKSVATALSR